MAIFPYDDYPPSPGLFISKNRARKQRRWISSQCRKLGRAMALYRDRMILDLFEVEIVGVERPEERD